MIRLWAFFRELSTRTWLALVLVVAVVESGILYLVYRPVAYNDTPAYRRLAGQILNGWADYDGTRMPGYPLFLAWLGNDEVVYMAQLGLGVLIALCLFYTGWLMTRRGWFAGLAAMLYTLNLQQVLVEPDLMSETLTIFLLALALTGLAWLVYTGARRPAWVVALGGLLVGLLMGLTALTRSLYAFLPVLAALCLLVFWRARLRLRFLAAVPLLLAGMLLVATWVNFIHSRFAIWSLDTMSGYHLMNHAGVFFERVPDEYAAVRDTFLVYRERQIAETGHPGNAIWDAIPELQEVTGLGFIPLSGYLAEICTRVILENPLLYLKNVAVGWVNFWRVPVHWAPLTPPWNSVQKAIILMLRVWLGLFNALFLAVSAAFVLRAVRLRLPMDAFTWTLAGLIWGSSILQALVEYGDNPRYALPIHVFILLLAAWWGYSLWLRPTRRSSSG